MFTNPFVTSLQLLFFDGVVHLPFYITLVFRDKFEPNVGCSTGEIMRKWANDKKQICATYDASQCKHLEAFSHDGCARNRSERNHFKIFRHVRVTFKLRQVHASVISENLYQTHFQIYEDAIRTTTRTLQSFLDMR